MTCHSENKGRSPVYEEERGSLIGRDDAVFRVHGFPGLELRTQLNVLERF